MSRTEVLRLSGVASHRLPRQPFSALLQSRYRPTQHRPQHVRTLFYLPTVLHPSFWRSLVPSFLRRDTSASATGAIRKPTNPATYFILMSLLIGSQAIQLITLRKTFVESTHHTDQKLKLLRDVVGRVKAGEDVDVEKELGTGDPDQEVQWEKVMKELESDDAIFAERKRAKRQREKRQKREAEEAAKQSE